MTDEQSRKKLLWPTHRDNHRLMTAPTTYKAVKTARNTQTAREQRLSAAAQHADRLDTIRGALDRIDPAVDNVADTLAGQLDAYTQIPAFPHSVGGNQNR